VENTIALDDASGHTALLYQRRNFRRLESGIHQSRYEAGPVQRENRDTGLGRI
jgi:hypothetical protein